MTTSRPTKLKHLTADRRSKQAARLALTTRLDRVAEHLREARDRPTDIEAVHRLRTSSRRAQAAIDAFRPCIKGKKRAKRARKLVKRLRKSVAEPRELDVLAEVWRSLAQEDPTLGEASAYMLRRTHDARERAAADVRAAARRVKPRAVRARRDDLLDRTRRARLDDGKARDLGELAHAQLRDLGADLVQAIADEPATPEGRHEIRIKAKKVRYALELFRRCLDRDAAKALKSDLKTIHDAVGDEHDLADAARELADAETEPGAGPALASLRTALDRKRAAAQTDAERSIRTFADRWIDRSGETIRLDGPADRPTRPDPPAPDGPSEPEPAVAAASG
jgi:CHAD domain-containing protein